MAALGWARCCLPDGKNEERRNYWGELSIWSTRRLGELIRDGQKKGSIDKGKGGDRKSHSHDASVKLGDLGIKHDQSARAQKIAAIPATDIHRYIGQQQRSSEEISKAGLLSYRTELLNSCWLD